jgi:hypothetical protein
MPDGKKTRGKPSGDKIVRNATSASVATAQPAEPPASGEIYDVAKLASKHGLSLADAMGLIKKNGNDRAVLDRAAEDFKKANRRYRS